MERKSISVILEQSDMPDLPGRTPIDAELSVVVNSLHIRAERSGTIGGDIVFEFDIMKDQINRIMVRYVSDVPDDFEYSPWNQPELSTATVHHKDPYDVVPEFVTVFSSPKSYWIKALCKMLVEKLGVTIEETHDT